MLHRSAAPTDVAVPVSTRRDVRRAARRRVPRAAGIVLSAAGLVAGYLAAPAVLPEQWTGRVVADRAESKLDSAADAAGDRALVAEGGAAGLVAGGAGALVPAAGLPDMDIQSGLLSTDVIADAGGTLAVVPGSTEAPGSGPVRSVRVEVEVGLPVDAAVFATFVMATLNDPRSWGVNGRMTFARTDGAADIRVVLASPTTVDELCAPVATQSVYSCGHNGVAAVNFTRWVQGIAAYGDDRTGYREYLVNHEVGHLLGHPHEQCPGAGEPAPAMQQQTVAVEPCTPNPWPYPDAA